MTRGFTSEVLAVDRDGGVATLWLDRPDARNAMGPAFWSDLPEAMGTMTADPDVRAVVVAARGPHFSVGLDLKAMGDLLVGDPSPGVPATHAGQEPASGTATGLDRSTAAGTGATPSAAVRTRATRQAIVRMQAAVTSVAECPKPVIAAVHGCCIGAGFDLVCACDIRLASADAVFSVRETKIAIVADLGSLQRLPRIVGSGHAAELALTGRDVGAARAKEIGLVNDVLADRDALLHAATTLAAQIADLSPLAVQGTKAVLAANDGRTVAQGLDYVATWNAGMLASDDLAEAVAAFAGKRQPRFTGR